MNFGLTEEQQMVVDTVRGFVEKEFYPLEPEVERTGHVPLEVGREIQRKARVAPGPLTEGGPPVSPRWVGSCLGMTG